MCASPARAYAPAESNEPPMNQPPAPSATTAFTVPVTGVNPASTWPVAGSSGTAPPVCGPTTEKVPPR